MWKFILVSHAYIFPSSFNIWGIDHPFGCAIESWGLYNHIPSFILSAYHIRTIAFPLDIKHYNVARLTLDIWVSLITNQMHGNCTILSQKQAQKATFHFFQRNNGNFIFVANYFILNLKNKMICINENEFIVDVYFIVPLGKWKTEKQSTNYGQILNYNILELESVYPSFVQTNESAKGYLIKEIIYVCIRVWNCRYHVMGSLRCFCCYKHRLKIWSRN